MRGFNLPSGVSMDVSNEAGASVAIQNARCLGRVSIRGGQVLGWQPNGHSSILWLSPGAIFSPGKSIRGGVPICWPWFGDHPTDPLKPSHGFARLRDWRLEGVQNTSDATIVSLRLPAHQHDQDLWPYGSRPTLNIALADTLSLRLTLTNSDAAPLTISQALHTYFTISDIGAVRISGLDGKTYYDKVTNTHDHLQSGDVSFDGELDRIYRHAEGEIELNDPGLKRSILINQTGGKSIVVWNPWIEKAGRLEDMGPPASYRSMVCIETGSIAEDSITLEPGATHTLETTIAVKSHSE
ncbi:MAG: D-hexose-6-phosphate mutarotase [Pseudomonadota bacterium]